MSFDPVGGQGANNGNKMARNLVESIIARKDLPFDAPWMTENFERFYAMCWSAESAFLLRARN